MDKNFTEVVCTYNDHQNSPYWYSRKIFGLTVGKKYLVDTNSIKVNQAGHLQCSVYNHDTKKFICRTLWRNFDAGSNFAHENFIRVSCIGSNLRGITKGEKCLLDITSLNGDWCGDWYGDIYREDRVLVFVGRYNLHHFKTR